MIITRTPFRISFVGGGTDLSDFYKKEGGAVLSSTIDKYVYIVANKRFDDKIRISYSKTELVEKIDEIQHPIVREALKLVGITKGIDIVSLADVPAGTGLGSSSSFTVGLLNALYGYVGRLVSSEQLAREACKIEIEILGEPIGKQDQYIAAYGGLKYIQFNADDSVRIDQCFCPEYEKEEINRNLLLFFTHQVRDARTILKEQKENIGGLTTFEILKKTRDLAIELKNIMNGEFSPDILGQFLNRGWLLKKQLAKGISSNQLDDYYERALKAGALGGKITGAGGGGFFLIYCPQERQAGVIQALHDFTKLEFHLVDVGSEIVDLSWGEKCLLFKNTSGVYANALMNSLAMR
jgi:D-glycero-alpha-D-manno-heptose-7-phosphate kinase